MDMAPWHGGSGRDLQVATQKCGSSHLCVYLCVYEQSQPNKDKNLLALNCNPSQELCSPHIVRMLPGMLRRLCPAHPTGAYGA